jgi:hypothetical protein
MSEGSSVSAELEFGDLLPLGTMFDRRKIKESSLPIEALYND